ncbi:substrate-binding domain-containing protein [Marinobacter sp. X15-166B]|uniref:substrate-binding domain-containing protein n=1 Tax=Marinobacter sp. X15-166B TaxID=1897620 RepID=UPI000ADFDDB5|nr:substrate-binding domain-containing protein [Marinobacter sp. X15-166B]
MAPTPSVPRWTPRLVSAFLQHRGGQPVTSRPRTHRNEHHLSTRIDGQPVSVLVAARGSSTGFHALAAEDADVWASSRPVNAREIAALAHRADLSSPVSEHILAIDGLAIVVHPSNPVAQFSMDTLARIFSGQISNWASLGGPDRAIRLYARDEHSGTWDTFQSLVLGDRYALHEQALRYSANDRLSDDVSRDPAGIGFVGLASVGNSKLAAVSDGMAPALIPNQLTLASEDYPLARRLYLYTSGQHPDKLVTDFIEFSQSDAGQRLVAQSGFIAQTPVAFPATHDDRVPPSFQSLTRNYLRLSVNFRFARGRTQLDNKAKRDLRRVVNYLQQHNKSSADLLLIGFADQQNDELRAQMISELRALSVSKALRQEGATAVAYTGYGHYLPVGSAGGVNGASRNGRVEVWVKP